MARADTSGRGDRVLEQTRALLALDPRSPATARRLGRRRGEILLLVDLLAAQEHVEEACELGLLLEQALEQLGEPVGAPTPTAAPGGRFRITEHLLGIARAAGHLFYEGEVLLRQAELWAEQGDREQAASLYAQVQALAQSGDLGLLNLAALAGLAGLAQDEGNVFKAHLLYTKQREQAAALGEPFLEAQALGNLSATALAMGDFRRGARYARERLQLCAKLRDEHGQAEALCSLGLAQRNLGDLAGSRHSYREALRLALRLGSPTLEATVCYNFGCLLVEAEPEQAAALLEHATRLAQQGGAALLVESSVRVTAQLAERLPPEVLGAARRQAARRVRALLE
ncbi:MAG: hypothetical protein RMK29_19240 [Myxococcales bacterium]|nr:hypothetical protein [Myxococcales bacterium]